MSNTAARSFAPTFPSFTAGDVGFATLLMLAVSILSAGACMLLGCSDNTRDIAATLALEAGLFLGVGLAVWRRRLSWRAVFGFRQSRLLFAVAIGLIGCVTFLPVIFGLNIFSHSLFSRIGYQSVEPPVVRWAVEQANPQSLWFLLIQAVVIAPICEELFFRGILLPTLCTRYSVWASVTLTSALFASFHFNLPSLLPLFVVAVGFSLAFLYARSLTASIVMHAAYNLINFAWLLGQPHL